MGDELTFDGLEEGMIIETEWGVAEVLAVLDDKVKLSLRDRKGLGRVVPRSQLGTVELLDVGREEAADAVTASPFKVRHLAGVKQVTRSRQKRADVRESAGHGAKSEVVREQAILALLTERSEAKAAAKCGISVRTLQRWLADDEDFKAAYASSRRTVFDAAMNRVKALTGKAIDTLDDLLDEREYPNVRLGAARTVAELGIHQHDAEGLSTRSGCRSTPLNRSITWNSSPASSSLLRVLSKSNFSSTSRMFGLKPAM